MRKFNLPEAKLNELAQSVSEKLLSNHFFDQNVILGEELKSFSDHNQINKFLIFQVYQVWDIQVSKLKHPYFDFESDDVQETLQILKNNLSRHIRITKEDFLPVLKRAVYNNLKLLVDPQQTFENFFFIQSDKLPLDVYKRYTQFFSDLGFVVNSIMKYYEKNQIETVEKDVFFLKMTKVVEIYNKKSEKGFDVYREELFQELTGTSITDIEAEIIAQQEALEAQRRAEEEARKQAEEEARRKEEEEKRKAEEEARRREEERIRAEEERKKAEEEARRLAEEERKKEEAKKQSFFDSLSSDDDGFDLDLDLDEDSILETEKTAETVEQPAEITAPSPEPVTEEVPEEEPAEQTSMVEAVAEEIVEEEPVIEETVVEEPVAEEIPANGVSEPVLEEESRSEPVAEEKGEFMEMAANMEPETPDSEVENPTVLETNGTKQESTASFLDRFLSEKENGVAQEPERPTSILDKLKERPSTEEPKRILETLNGNRKIKLDEIPIHKQYQYVQKVFDGNNVRFRIIVDKINNARNKDEVEDILDKFVFSNNELDKNDAVVSEFIELLRNRF
jgi:hypothetical protein